MLTHLLPAGVSEDLMKLAGEEIRELVIDRHHIADYGFWAVVLALVVGAILHWASD